MATVYEIVTDKIIESLENGVAPWRKPWTVEGGFHRNFNSKRAYTGINQFLLQLSGFDSPYWGTYNGWVKAAGLTPKSKIMAPGQNMSLVTFAKKCDKKDGTGTYFMYRYYKVLNFEQLLPEVQAAIKLPTKKEIAEIDAIDAAQEVVDGYFENEDCTLKHGFDSACFIPSKDQILMPNRNSFDNSEFYYNTLFHEMAHSTGIESRLDRGIEENSGFGSDSYSKEELVAEMTAAFLCAMTGVENTTEASAAYLEGWARRLKQDKAEDKNPAKLIVQAASAAQKAAGFIAGERAAEALGSPEDASEAALATA